MTRLGSSLRSRPRGDLWPGQDPLGRALREESGREYSVIGVAKDAQVAHLGQLDTNYLYFPIGPEDDLRSYVLVRYSTPITDAAKSIRDLAQSIDPGVSVDVTPLEDYLEVWRAPSRIVAALSGSLGALGPDALLDWRVRDGVL